MRHSVMRANHARSRTITYPSFSTTFGESKPRALGHPLWLRCPEAAAELGTCPPKRRRRQSPPPRPWPSNSALARPAGAAADQALVEQWSKEYPSALRKGTGERPPDKETRYLAVPVKLNDADPGSRQILSGRAGLVRERPVRATRSRSRRDGQQDHSRRLDCARAGPSSGVRVPPTSRYWCTGWRRRHCARIRSPFALQQQDLPAQSVSRPCDEAARSPRWP
jgi:hypothetical protein